MANSILFHFKDGVKEIKVGDKFFSYLRGRLIEQTIIKIGRELITCQREKFYIKTGLAQSEYTSAIAYSSKEAYEKSCEEDRFTQEVQNKIRSARLTYKQAIAISQILEG